MWVACHLDWEFARAGDPLWNLGTLDFRRAEEGDLADAGRARGGFPLTPELAEMEPVTSAVFDDTCASLIQIASRRA